MRGPTNLVGSHATHLGSHTTQAPAAAPPLAPPTIRPGSGRSGPPRASTRTTTDSDGLRGPGRGHFSPEKRLPPVSGRHTGQMFRRGHRDTARASLTRAWGCNSAPRRSAPTMKKPQRQDCPRGVTGQPRSPSCGSRALAGITASAVAPARAALLRHGGGGIAESLSTRHLLPACVPSKVGPLYTISRSSADSFAWISELAFEHSNAPRPNFFCPNIRNLAHEESKSGSSSRRSGLKFAPTVPASNDRLLCSPMRIASAVFRASHRAPGAVFCPVT